MGFFGEGEAFISWMPSNTFFLFCGVVPLLTTAKGLRAGAFSFSALPVRVGDTTCATTALDAGGGMALESLLESVLLSSTKVTLRGAGEDSSSKVGASW